MLDHTADIGFEIRSATLEGLFDEALRALLMVLFERPPEQGGDEREVNLPAPDLETLLVRWLNELIYLVQDVGFVPVRSDIRILQAEKSCSLETRLIGAPLDLQAYAWQGEVKSATFHGMDITHTDEGWGTRVILDV